jgi:hypothetical protein
MIVPVQHPSFDELDYQQRRLVELLVASDSESEALPRSEASYSALVVAAQCLGAERTLIVVSNLGGVRDWQLAWTEAGQPCGHAKSYQHYSHDPAVHGAIHGVHISTLSDVQHYRDLWEQRSYDLVICDAVDGLEWLDPQARRIWWRSELLLEARTPAERFLREGFPTAVAPGSRSRPSALADRKLGNWRAEGSIVYL